MLLSRSRRVSARINYVGNNKKGTTLRLPISCMKIYGTQGDLALPSRPYLLELATLELEHMDGLEPGVRDAQAVIARKGVVGRRERNDGRAADGERRGGTDALVDAASYGIRIARPAQCDGLYGRDGDAVHVRSERAIGSTGSSVGSFGIIGCFGVV